MVFQDSRIATIGRLFTVRSIPGPDLVPTRTLSCGQPVVGGVGDVLLSIPEQRSGNQVGPMVRNRYCSYIFDVHSVLVLCGSSCPRELSVESELLFLLVPLGRRDRLPLVRSNNLLFHAERLVPASSRGQTCCMTDSVHRFLPVHGVKVFSRLAQSLASR
jgi:hypothetical protein